MSGFDEAFNFDAFDVSVTSAEMTIGDAVVTVCTVTDVAVTVCVVSDAVVPL